MYYFPSKHQRLGLAMHSFPSNKLGFGTHNPLISQQKLGFGAQNALINSPVKTRAWDSRMTSLSQAELGLGPTMQYFSSRN